ncbi:MAG: hypothetical protein GY870_12910 [archaeon]|nr:hypothetical protein [archaeon]
MEKSSNLIGNKTKIQESEWRIVKKKVTQLDDEAKNSQGALTTIKRECLKCKTIIESKVLEQCPICYSELSPLPDIQKKALLKLFNKGNRKYSWKEKKLKPN